tara:strand:- start:636 stop:1577 length:942 start_codon:yes stop_codon:yes gene_type:complete
MAVEEVESPPETAENESITLADIAEEAGIGELFSDSQESPEQPEEQEQEEAPEEEVQPEPDLAEEEVVQQDESPGVQKRIGKLIERANAAEEKNKQLEERLKSVEAGAPDKPKELDTGFSRFEGIHDVAEVDKRESDAEHLRAWLMQNSEGGTYQDRSGTEYELDFEQSRKLMVDTDLDLRKNIPRAREEVARRATNVSTAKQVFAWMNDPESKESLDVQQVLAASDHMKKYYENDPFAPLLIGYAVEGFQAKAAQAQKAKAPPKAAPSTPNSPRAAPVSRKKSSKDANAKLLQEALSTGDVTDAASYLESIL